MRTRRRKFLKFLLGIGIFMTSMLTIWTMAAVIMYYATENGMLDKEWTAMLNDGQLVAAAARSGAGNPGDVLRELSRGEETSSVIYAGKGRPEQDAALGARSASLTAHVSPAEVKKVLEGGTVKDFYRSHRWSQGHAVTGQPVVWNGQPHALFLERRVGGPFTGYGKFLVTNLLACVLFFVAGGIVSIFERRRHRHPFMLLIDAMKRIAKGDFNISLDADKRMGHFGVLVEGFNNMAEELSQMESMRQEFISNVSHEIQSPLNSINGFTRALKKEGLSEEKRAHYLDIIEMESKRLSKLSDNLLKLTSLESKHHPFEPVRYRLDKQLRSIVLSCEPQWMDKELDMDVSLEEAELTADRDLLSQVWMNLIHNSIKFTPKGGVIRVHCRAENGKAVVEIADTGIGISDEDQSHVFERFFKADASRNRAIGGSGLGLSIVKTIVDKHRGSIQVRSKLGEGTSFTVQLPVEAMAGAGAGRK